MLSCCTIQSIPDFFHWQKKNKPSRALTSLARTNRGKSESPRSGSTDEPEQGLREREGIVTARWTSEPSNESRRQRERETWVRARADKRSHGCGQYLNESVEVQTGKYSHCVQELQEKTIQRQREWGGLRVWILRFISPADARVAQATKETRSLWREFWQWSWLILGS